NLEIGERLDGIQKQEPDPRGVRHFRKPLTLFCVFVSSTGGLDLIFVPGLGFDKHGNRLGRGKGYYDSYLTRCLQQRDSKPYTVALAFREQMCLWVPVDEHDVRVDEVLYEDST
ncbi:5-formyltetrahydrofolate cyclo-ligase, partial [Lynx canadensis]|uniref:5-formyltetrahydrofolate cyclo-ligase n=1 Tax=Lynx canadensis TaxID=61383 RepID=UPI0011AFDAE0